MGLSQQVSCPPAPWGTENTPERAGPCYTHSHHPALPRPSTEHNGDALGLCGLFKTRLLCRPVHSTRGGSAGSGPNTQPGPVHRGRWAHSCGWLNAWRHGWVNTGRHARRDACADGGLHGRMGGRINSVEQMGKVAALVHLGCYHEIP